jgi:hypothetical protein
VIVGWRNAFPDQKRPKGIDFFPEPAGKSPRIILSAFIKGDKADESGIKCLPLPDRRRGMCHMKETLQFCLSDIFHFLTISLIK